MPSTAELLDRAKLIADSVLAPRAATIDQQTLINFDDLRPLADAGLFGVGDGSLDAQTMRRLVATIGGGCGATFFCWVQHHGVVRLLRACDNNELRSAWVEPLLRGDFLAGTAFAHLRRMGEPAVRATRCAGGWRFDGVAPWATSWGVARVFSIAAASDDGEVVWGVIDGVDQPGLRAEPLHLPVFSSTGTVAFHFDGLIVPDERIALVADVHAWRHADRVRAALGQPAVLGVAERASALLADRGDSDAVGAADALRDRIAALWVHDDRLVDDIAANGLVDDAAFARVSDHRAACLDVSRSATAALLAAVGGAGMNLEHPAQRLSRESAFYTIQAQTADGRAATLRSMRQ